MITVKDILRNKKFSNLKLINSEADLGREVSTIESTETPDIASYLSPNAFLLTTAMVYKDKQKELSNLIVQLNNLPCAALGIKLGRFVDKLDDEVIKTANRLNFPLIQIPIDITLGEVFHKLLSHLWSNQNEELLYSLNIQKTFSNLMIRNASLDVLIRNLSHTLKLPIALVDPFGNVVSTSSNVERSRYKKDLRNIVESLSSRRDSSLPTSIYLEEISVNNKKASIYPITMASYYPHYLIIFDADNMEYPLSDMAIEQAILILAFTLYKNLRVAFSTLSSKEEFFRDLMNKKAYETFNEAQTLYQGDKYGFISSSNYQIIIASITNKDKFLNNNPVMEEWYTLIYKWLDSKLSKDVKEYVLFPDRDKYDYVILLQKPVNNLIERLTSYRDVLENTIQLDINFFIGEIAQDISSIKHSYRDALNAMEFGTLKEDIKFIKYYNKLDTVELLHLLPKNQIDVFVIDNLKQLAYPKDEHTLDLKKTLKVFLDKNCNITDTASILFVHRNTVKYRIDQCVKILDCDITDPNKSLNLRLALAYTEDKRK